MPRFPHSITSHSTLPPNSLDIPYIIYSPHPSYPSTPLTPSAQSKEMAAVIRAESAYWKPIYEEEDRRTRAEEYGIW